jgi:hypothetical protein
MRWLNEKRPGLVTVMCVVVVVAGIMLLWFRIRSEVPNNMIHEASRRETENTFEVVYRTHQPFHVRVVHNISELGAGPEQGQKVRGKTYREETVLDVPARYDWIHSDYCLLLEVDCSRNLVVTANGEAVDVPVWSGVPLSSVRFGGSRVRMNRRLGGGHHLGSGCGWALVDFDTAGNTEEMLIVYPTLEKHREE